MESFYNIKNGCKKWHDCFTCPFDDCRISKVEKKSNGGSKVRVERNSKLKELLIKGYNTEQAAKFVGVSKRTAQRANALVKSINR